MKAKEVDTCPLGYGVGMFKYITSFGRFLSEIPGEHSKNTFEAFSPPSSPLLAHLHEAHLSLPNDVTEALF